MAKKKVGGTASARDRLLAAANELFYEEGVHTVGIDRVIERAGVAKASLYSTFGSKDELIRAYLSARHEARQRRLTQALARLDDPREKILAVFDVLGEIFVDSKYRGCAFVRASAEAGPESPARAVAAQARAWTRSLFTELARAVGARAPEALAQQLILLHDGATVAAQMDHDPTAARAARTVAAALLDEEARRAACSPAAADPY
jgi:AcrR family transcriptional regulator